MKRLFAVVLAAVFAMLCLTGCKKKEEALEDTYSGVLTKVRLGMPMKKVQGLNSGNQLYYGSDTEIWCVSSDIDLMEIAGRLPENDQFFYVQQSLITYNFKFVETEQDYLLSGYDEELLGLIPRATAMDYYNLKKKQLIEKYNANPEAVTTTCTGTEGVDNSLEYRTELILSSFTVSFDMELKYDTIDGVDDYYGDYFKISVEEVKNKAAVEITDEEEKK